MGEDAKEKLKALEKLFSPVSSRFIFVFAFSIQRTRLSRSLGQAKNYFERIIFENKFLGFCFYMTGRISIHLEGCYPQRPSP